MLRKIKSEDILRKQTDTEERKHGEQTGLDTPVVREVNDAYMNEGENMLPEE